MCVYCEGVFTPDTAVCPTCNEYDGLTRFDKAIEILGLDPADFQ
jgi:RNA polymerase subunit RPABC4/transcription elongation factor Spt4